MYKEILKKDLSKNFFILALCNNIDHHINFHVHDIGYISIYEKLHKNTLFIQDKYCNIYKINNNIKIIIINGCINHTGYSAYMSLYNNSLLNANNHYIVLYDNILIKNNIYKIQNKKIKIGHNGIKNIQEYIQNNITYIGIGVKPEIQIQIKDYVLTHATKQQIIFAQKLGNDIIEYLLN